MRLPLVVQVLVLVLVANGTPVIAKALLGRRFAHPLDGGRMWCDGKPLLGGSKTIRGVVLAILATSASAPIVGLDWIVGAAIGGAAMAGDLVSSFVKRRLGLAPSSRATGLDQIPESLLPLLACRPLLALTAADIVIGVALFFAGEIVLSRLLYRLGIRSRPY